MSISSGPFRVVAQMVESVASCRRIPGASSNAPVRRPRCHIFHALLLGSDVLGSSNRAVLEARTDRRIAGSCEG